MADLVEFLRARLDEDEQAARAAIEPRGYPRPDDGVWTVGEGSVEVEGVGIHIYDEGGHSAAQAIHIARHDPARVLADVEAKRLQLALHKGCDASCYVVRVLALPYASHPDYREEWKP